MKYLKDNKYRRKICEQSRTHLRTTHPVVFYEKVILKDFVKFIEKHLCRSLLFSKITGLRPVTLLKKRLRHMCLPMNLAKFLRTPSLQNFSG